MTTIESSHVSTFRASAKSPRLLAGLLGFAGRLRDALAAQVRHPALPRDERLRRDIGLLGEEDQTERNIALYMDPFADRGLNADQVLARMRGRVL